MRMLKDLKDWFWKAAWNHELFYAAAILATLVIVGLLVYGQFFGGG